MCVYRGRWWVPRIWSIRVHASDDLGGGNPEVFEDQIAEHGPMLGSSWNSAYSVYSCQLVCQMFPVTSTTAVLPKSNLRGRMVLI